MTPLKKTDVLVFSRFGKTHTVFPTSEVRTREQLVSLVVPRDSRGTVVFKDKKDLDLEYMECFKTEGGDVQVDIEKAKSKKLREIRLLRNPLLNEADVLMMKALESGTKKDQKRIAEYKQRLRDVTTVVLPNTLSELKRFRPSVLDEDPNVE